MPSSIHVVDSMPSIRAVGNSRRRQFAAFRPLIRAADLCRRVVPPAHADARC
jgi:hypothetical protein